MLNIIPSRTSQNFDPLFLFYSHIITYYSYSSYFIINIYNTHNDYYTGEQNIASVDFSSKST